MYICYEHNIIIIMWYIVYAYDSNTSRTRKIYKTVCVNNRKILSLHAHARTHSHVITRCIIIITYHIIYTRTYQNNIITINVTYTRRTWRSSVYQWRVRISGYDSAEPLNACYYIIVIIILLSHGDGGFLHSDFTASVRPGSCPILSTETIRHPHPERHR